MDEVQEVTAGSEVRSASSLASCSAGAGRLEVVRGVGGVGRRCVRRFTTKKNRLKASGDALGERERNQREGAG
jgi:hypothetical protein